MNKLIPKYLNSGKFVHPLTETYEDSNHDIRDSEGNIVKPILYKRPDNSYYALYPNGFLVLLSMINDLGTFEDEAGRTYTLPHLSQETTLNDEHGKPVEKDDLSLKFRNWWRSAYNNGNNPVTAIANTGVGYLVPGLSTIQALRDYGKMSHEIYNGVKNDHYISAGLNMAMLGLSMPRLLRMPELLPELPQVISIPELARNPIITKNPVQQFNRIKATPEERAMLLEYADNNYGFTQILPESTWDVFGPRVNRLFLDDFVTPGKFHTSAEIIEPGVYDTLMRRKYAMSTRPNSAEAFADFPNYGRDLSSYDVHSMGHFGYNPRSYMRVMQEEWNNANHGGLIGFNMHGSTSSSSTPMFLAQLIQKYRAGKIAKPYISESNPTYQMNNMGTGFRVFKKNGKTYYKQDHNTENFDFNRHVDGYATLEEYLDNVLMPKYNELREVTGQTLKEIPNPTISTNQFGEKVLNLPSILAPKLKKGGKLIKRWIKN